MQQMATRKMMKIDHRMMVNDQIFLIFYLYFCSVCLDIPGEEQFDEEG